MENKVDYILNQQGLRKTNLRKKLLTFFMANSGPQTLIKVKKAVSAVTTDRVTLYRELERLQEVNLVESLVINNATSYELVDKHHHHAVCEKCKKVRCLPCHNSNKNDGLAGWKKIKHQVLISGLCSNCAKKYDA